MDKTDWLCTSHWTLVQYYQGLGRGASGSAGYPFSGTPVTFVGDNAKLHCMKKNERYERESGCCPSVSPAFATYRVVGR